MATINKVYPHVNVTTKALLRTIPEIAESGATSLFAPFYSKKGPSGKIQRIFNLNQFVAEYGEPDFSYQGRSILDIYNWLSAGGSLYALRLVSPNAVKASGSLDLASFYDYDQYWYDKSGNILHTYTADTTSWTTAIFGPGPGAVANKFYGTKLTAFPEPTAFNLGQYFLVGNELKKVEDVGGTATLSSTITTATEFFATNTNSLYLYSEFGTWSIPVVLKTYKPLEILVQAKYEGNYYNDVSLFITRSKYSTSNESFLDVQVLLKNQRVQSLFKLNAERFGEVLSGTEYVNVSLSNYTDFEELVGIVSGGVSIPLTGGIDGLFSFEDSLARFYGISKLSLESDTFVLPSNTNNGTTILQIALSSGVNNTTSYVKWAKGDILNISTGTNFIIGEISDEPTATNIPIRILSRFPQTGEVTGTWTIRLQDDYEYVSAESMLSNKLETPADVIFDSGHSLTIKNLMKEFSEVRDDIFFFLSDFEFTSKDNGDIANVIAEKLNQAVYAQKFSVDDVISGKNIWVGPTYFLASLIPFNDRIYGMQWPTAGLTRGVLSGVKAINSNPNNEDKDLFYTTRINYVEKDSRGYKFMSQLTGDSFIENTSGEYQETSLKFINNARVTNRIVRDLEELGRDYLFEFNDAATLLNMRNALNRYVTEWVQNRTLSQANVEVAKDPYSDERVNVTLNIKFTGTIEIISIDITIE
jgi:hypothetical protein